MPDEMSTDDSSEKNDEIVIQATRDSTVTQQLDTVFDCLRSARSRHLLYYLSDTEETVVSVEEAVEAVQKYEATSRETGELPSRQSVRIDLINACFPRLQAAGVLVHDPRRGEIRLDGIAHIEEWLERSRQRELY